MNVTIIGVGNMGRGIGTRMVAGGNSVTLVGRSPEKTGTLAEELRAAAKKDAAVKTSPLGSPIQDEVVILAVPYPADVSIVKDYGNKLAGKTIVSISTPLNASYDGLATPPGTSAAEELARVAPAHAKIIKAFNTNFSRLLVAGNVSGQPMDVFVAGDDAQAKTVIAGLIEAGGLRPLDVGSLERARYLEGLHLINISLQSRLEKPWLNAIKIVS